MNTMVWYDIYIYIYIPLCCVTLQTYMHICSSNKYGGVEDILGLKLAVNLGTSIVKQQQWGDGDVPKIDEFLEHNSNHGISFQVLAINMNPKH